MIEQQLSKTSIITQLAQSPHGKLEAYLPVGEVAARQEPEFLSHLIAWNRIHGQVRDAKVGLPVVFLAKASFHEEYCDNALAHLALLDVRNFEQAVRFAKAQHARMHRVNDLVRREIKTRTADALEKRLKEAKARFESLKPASERRDEAAAEIKKLEEMLTVQP